MWTVINKLTLTPLRPAEHEEVGVRVALEPQLNDDRSALFGFGQLNHGPTE
jgi:hypothetical protein